MRTFLLAQIFPKHGKITFSLLKVGLHRSFLTLHLPIEVIEVGASDGDVFVSVRTSCVCVCACVSAGWRWLLCGAGGVCSGAHCVCVCVCVCAQVPSVCSDVLRFPVCAQVSIVCSGAQCVSNSAQKITFECLDGF